MEHKYCLNEDRISKLEVYTKEKENKLHSLEKNFKNLDNNLHELSIHLMQINTILSTLKWVIGIFIALFGGIICFMVKGVIHIL